jgi:phosphoribosylanthranilate isomerase
MVKVKISGMRRVEDAFSAIRWGADAVAFGVGQRYPSHDFIEAEAAREMVRQLPPLISKVLVTHLLLAEEVMALTDRIAVDTVQLHSEITPAQLQLLREQRPHLRLLKSFHVVDEASIDYGLPYRHLVDGFVLDSVDVETGSIGGTGLIHDWELSRQVVVRYPIPMILAGGLTPENVRLAWETVKPYAVDANSGLRDAHGFKDHARVHEFISNAKAGFFG